MIKYTLCFIKRGNKILMLNRELPYWMGNWNGVGGKIEDGETKEQSIIREVYEETEIEVESVSYKGIVTWDEENNEKGGMYIYIAEVDSVYIYNTPKKTIEGILDWKKIDWILHPRNTGVVGNIRYFLPKMLGDDKAYEHYLIYEGNELLRVESTILFER